MQVVVTSVPSTVLVVTEDIGILTVKADSASIPATTNATTTRASLTKNSHRSHDFVNLGGDGALLEAGLGQGSSKGPR